MSEVNYEDREDSSIIFHKDSDVYCYIDHRLVRKTRGAIVEVSFDEFSKAVQSKYNIDLELPIEELYQASFAKIKSIGFECYATYEIRKITNFVADNRDEILAREKQHTLDRNIDRLFEALDELRRIDPENDWNILCNDEILVRDTYGKMKKLGSRDQH